jgi:glycosyltransferase involved in cell wall biosynthesis
VEQNSARSVVHVISDAGPHPYFRTLIEAGGIDRSKIAVGCIGPPGALNEDMQSLGVLSFALGARTRASYPVALIRLTRLLERLKAQVVQTHLLDGSLVGLSAARLAGTPATVMTAHHSHELPFHGRRLLWPERMCAGPLCDHIIAPSRQVARTLAVFAGVPDRKIEVVHHGFDLDRLDPTKVDGHAVRGELGLEGKLVFGAIGRLYRLKNHTALLEAFASVLGGNPQAFLLIVGAGDAAPLRSAARGLGIGERVVLCGPRADIPSVLAAMDVFIHPAIAESFGMVIIEAMAMARPVISTPVGIAPEVIEPSKTGVLCTTYHPAALAHGLREMLSLRDQWITMAQAARARVGAFTARAMAARYEELYVEWATHNPANSATNRA